MDQTKQIRELEDLVESFYHLHTASNDLDEVGGISDEAHELYTREEDTLFEIVAHTLNMLIDYEDCGQPDDILRLLGTISNHMV